MTSVSRFTIKGTSFMMHIVHDVLGGECFGIFESIRIPRNEDRKFLAFAHFHPGDFDLCYFSLYENDISIGIH